MFIIQSHKTMAEIKHTSDDEEDIEYERKFVIEEETRTIKCSCGKFIRVRAFQDEECRDCIEVGNHDNILSVEQNEDEDEDDTLNVYIICICKTKYNFIITPKDFHTRTVTTTDTGRVDTLIVNTMKYVIRVFVLINK